MQVEIGNSGYRIITDPRNFILQEKRICGEKSKTPGAVMWDDIGYYSSLGGVINGCLSHGLKLADLESVQALKNHLDTLGTEILKSLQKHYEGVE